MPEKVASELRSERGEATSIFRERGQLRSHGTKTQTKNTGQAMSSRSMPKAHVADKVGEGKSCRQWNWRAGPTRPSRALQALVRNSELFPM